MAQATELRCLIVERHEWETGFAGEQLQIPLAAAEEFFGSGAQRRDIRVRIRGAGPTEYPCSISRRHPNGTRRVNGLDLVGLLGSCFVFLQETDVDGLYEFWVQYDVAIVAARFSDWQQGRNSQHGRGRLAIIVSALPQGDIERID